MASDFSIPLPKMDSNDPSQIMARWEVLITEYEALRDALREHTRQIHWQGVTPYITMLKNEAALAERTIEKERADSAAANDTEGGPDENNPGDGKISFAMSQALTNIAARETMWRIVKTSPGGLLAIDRRFPRSVSKVVAAQLPGMAVKKPRQFHRGSNVRAINAHSRRGEGVFVNAVVDDGFEWLRVLTTTTKQLLIAMTENGWEWGEDSDDSDSDSDSEYAHSEEADGENSREDGENTEIPAVDKATLKAISKIEYLAGIPLVEAILDLVDVARVNRCRGAYPHICVVLTRVDEEGDEKSAPEIMRFLQVLRRGLSAMTSTFEPDIDGNPMRVTIHTARSQRATAEPPFDIADTLKSCMPMTSNCLTPTLNIDTSILIALASDISHQPIEIEDWFPAQRVDEVTHERENPGEMLKSLCDVMRGRKLVCTREAAAAFKTMIGDMGQDREKKRASILVRGSDDGSDALNAELPSQESLVQQYRTLTQHPDYIPDDLLLPIRVIDEDWNLDRIKEVSENLSANGSQMPAIAHNVAQDMYASGPTLSVFFYGWSSGHTIVTTNSLARAKITRFLEKHRTSSREAGPHVWLSRPVRSLNGTNPRGSAKNE